jgi:GntR family transcriptional repressor for pyruvate dehydrogenase complex
MSEPRAPAGEYARVLDQVLDDASPHRALRPVRVPTAAAEVADRLVTAIALGEYLPGERLPSERDLAALLGVSRSTIREASGRLLAAGLVDVRRGRQGGIYVRERWTAESAEAVRRTLLPRWDEMEQLFDLRCLVEGMVARTAAQRRGAEDIARMRAALDRLASAGTPYQEHAADITFHQTVVAATHNPQIAGLSHELLTKVSLGLPIEPFDSDPEVCARALREHTQMCEAIEAGDADRAGSLAQGHFTITNEAVRDALFRASPQDL